MNIYGIFLGCYLLFSPISTYAQSMPLVEEPPIVLNSNYIVNEDGSIMTKELSKEQMLEIENTVAINDPAYKQQNERIYYTVYEDGIASTLPKDLQDWVYTMCAEYGISGYEKMIMAKLYCESGYNPSTIHTNKNGTKDYGIAQINSCNHKRLRSTLGITDFLDPYQSIRCGVYMMSECLKANGFNESMALAAYNTGKNGITSTKYTRKVLSIKDSAVICEF